VTIRLKNSTNFPDEKITEIIQFVKPNNLPTPCNFDVRVTNCSSRKVYQGIYYSSEGTTRRPQITLRVAQDEKAFPSYIDETPKVRRPLRKAVLYYKEFNEKTQQYQTWRSWKWYTSIKDKEKKMTSGGYISQLILSREEALISVAAHELRYHWQSNHWPSKRGRVWGAKGQYSNRDADAYAIRKLREWRRKHNNIQDLGLLIRWLFRDEEKLPTAATEVKNQDGKIKALSSSLRTEHDDIPLSLLTQEQQFVEYSNGICKICGQDYSFKPNFEGVKTSIDVIPELLFKQTKKKIFEVAY
jgi:hypothetical protein